MASGARHATRSFRVLHLRFKEHPRLFTDSAFSQRKGLGASWSFPKFTASEVKHSLSNHCSHVFLSCILCARHILPLFTFFGILFMVLFFPP